MAALYPDVHQGGQTKTKQEYQKKNTVTLEIHLFTNDLCCHNDNKSECYIQSHQLVALLTHGVQNQTSQTESKKSG